MAFIVAGGIVCFPPVAVYGIALLRLKINQAIDATHLFIAVTCPTCLCTFPCSVTAQTSGQHCQFAENPSRRIHRTRSVEPTRFSNCSHCRQTRRRLTGTTYLRPVESAANRENRRTL